MTSLMVNQEFPLKIYLQLLKRKEHLNLQPIFIEGIIEYVLNMSKLRVKSNVASLRSFSFDAIKIGSFATKATRFFHMSFSCFVASLFPILMALKRKERSEV